MERLRPTKKDTVLYSLELGILLVVLSWGFPDYVKRITKERVHDRCQKCDKHIPNKFGSMDQRKVLQMHHICFESVAKEFEIPDTLYNHPANALAVCDGCHKRIHRRLPLVSLAQKEVMIAELFRSIIEYHEDESSEGDRRLWKTSQEKILELVRQHAQRLGIEL